MIHKIKYLKNTNGGENESVIYNIGGKKYKTFDGAEAAIELRKKHGFNGDVKRINLTGDEFKIQTRNKPRPPFTHYRFQDLYGDIEDAGRGSGGVLEKYENKYGLYDVTEQKVQNK